MPVCSFWVCSSRSNRLRVHPVCIRTFFHARMPASPIISQHPERRVGHTVKTHSILFMHVRTLLEELRDQFGHALPHGIKERVLAAVLAERSLHFVCVGEVERSEAVLRGAGTSECDVEGKRSCVAYAHLISHTEGSRHIHTHRHSI